MPSAFTVTQNDYSRERTTVRWQGAALDGTNYDAQEGLAGTLVSAIAGVSLGVVYKTALAEISENPDNAASDPSAQREMKWLVTLTGGGQTKTKSIGCADYSLLEPNTEIMAAGGERTALINAIENFELSDNGSAMTVQLPIRLVGRST